MRPDFTDIKLDKLKGQQVEHKPAAEAAGDWLTPENITLKNVYDRGDVIDINHLSYAAGMPPVLRGPYTTMYVIRPWTIRQYAGFSTAE